MVTKAGIAKIERNYGIEALRLAAMLSVVTLHTISYGGVFAATTGGKNAVSWLIYLIAYPAVDCFALISGYVGYRETETEYKYSKYLVMWLQAFIYSFGFSMVANLLGICEIGRKELLKAALVITTNQFWYFTKYTALFFVIPWLNKMVRACRRRELNYLIILILLVFSTYGTLAMRIGGDVFDLKQGFSFVWLVSLYIVGAWMKREEIPEKLSGKIAVCILIGMVAVEWIAMVFFQNVIGGGTIVSYISPTIVACAIAYVSIFAKLKIPNLWIKVIKAFSPAAFGVYLISSQNLISSFLANKFTWIGKLNIALLPGMIVICAFAVFLICLLIDWLRKALFRIIKVELFFEKCEKKLKRWLL